MRTPEELENRQHLRRGERYTPENQETEGLWQKLWQHPEREEKPPAKHQVEEERAMTPAKSAETKPISYSQEREQHIKRAEHTTPYIRGPKWKATLYQRWQRMLETTGFKNKTLWDILSLQAIVAVALLVVQQSFSYQQAKTERERYLNNSLDSYITAMTDLMLKKDYNPDNGNLSENKSGIEQTKNGNPNNGELSDKKFGIEQAKTVSILKLLEGEREKQQRVIYFLRSSGLLEAERNIISTTEQKGLLNKANLAELNLSGVELTTADLKGANFRAAILNGIVLNKSDLTKANLSGAKLKAPYLFNSQLQGADLTDANLTDAILEQAKLLCIPNTRECAVLINANLTGANLTGAKLKKANLTKANLTNAFHYATSDPNSPKIYLNENDDMLQGAILCKTKMSNGQVSNRDCPPNK